MAWLLLLVLCCVCLYSPLQVVQAFRNQNSFKSSFQQLSKVHPLQTAGDVGSVSSIPRLEPGLRVSKSPADLFAREEVLSFSSFSLQQLMQYEKIMVVEDANQDKKSNIIPLNTLFAQAKQSMQKYTDVFVKYFRKLIAASMVIASSVNPMAVKRASLVTGTLMMTLASGPKMIARAGVLKKYQTLTAAQRLATTPLYFVANSRGNSYLQDDMQAGKPEQKVVVYFMSSEDANDYLEEMSQVNSANVNELRIMTVSMEKVLNQIQSKKQSRKLGRYEMDLIYRIQPSSRQCENADRLLNKRDSKTGKLVAAKSVDNELSIPMFSADGLAIKRGNGEMVTPYYFAYEDLLEDWNKMISSVGTDRKDIPREPKVAVRDFTEVMCLAQGISKDSIQGKDIVSNLLDQNLAGGATSSGLTSEQIKAALQTPGIVPPRREIEMIKNFYRNKAGTKNEFSKSKLLLK